LAPPKTKGRFALQTGLFYCLSHTELARMHTGDPVMNFQETQQNILAELFTKLSQVSAKLPNTANRKQAIDVAITAADALQLAYGDTQTHTFSTPLHTLSRQPTDNAPSTSMERIRNILYVNHVVSPILNDIRSISQLPADLLNMSHPQAAALQRLARMKLHQSQKLLQT